MQRTHYTWGNDSHIHHIEMRKLETGALEAFIYAPEQMAPAGQAGGALVQIPQELQQKGYSTVADHVDGRDVLRVTGFGKEQDIIDALAAGSHVQGQPQQQVVGEKEHKPFADKVRKHTVKLSGLFGIIGHAAMGTLGVLQGDSKRVASSALYTTATLTSAVYGAGESEGLDAVIDDMKAYLEKQGVEIPKGEKLNADELAKKGGVIETLHNYVKKHPLEVGNTVGLMGNIMLTYSGLKGGDKVEPARVASGLASMLGALTIILVKEKKKDGQGQFAWPGLENEEGVAAPSLTPEQLAEKEAKRSPLKKVADFVQERPMRTAGLLGLSGNIAMFADAHSIHKTAKQQLQSFEEGMPAVQGGEREDWTQRHAKEKLKSNAQGVLAFTTAATYMIATAFTSLSSKTKVTDYSEQEMLDKLCAMSAEFVMQQPQELRDDVIGKVATYLAKKPEITEDRQQIISTLNEKITQLTHSPWAAKISAQQTRSAQQEPTSHGIG